MGKRPIAVTVIGWLFIAAGAVGMVYHATELDLARPFSNDAVWVTLVRVVAVVSGAFVLRGRNWARWSLIGWLGYHVILSVVHTPFELIVHALLLFGVAFFLFRPGASRYFGMPQSNGDEPVSAEGNLP